MAEETKEQSCAEFALFVTLKIIGVLVALYFFLAMGGSFGALGGKGAGELFTITDNPVAGLMVGVLATVLVQSSSTSTSIVVGLVGADVLSPRQAIPIIMGANIGTSVTNTIVSMAHSGDRLELERAFFGATVHDMFNMLTVVTLLPLEIIIGAMSGEGGLLYWMSRGLTEAAFGESETDLTFPSPTKEIVSPRVKAVLSKDKNVVKALSFGAPPSYTMPSGSVTYYCVSSAMSKAWKKVAEDAYEGLTNCSGFRNECADGSSCYTDAGDYYTNEIAGARLIGKGFLKGAGDVAGGIIGLILSLLVLCGALYVLVRLLQSLVMGQAKKVIMKGTKMNDYLAMLLGLVITIIVLKFCDHVCLDSSCWHRSSARAQDVAHDSWSQHRHNLHFHPGCLCCHEIQQHPDCFLPPAVQHHWHPHLVPSASDAQGDCESCLHSQLLCFILALGAPHLHPGDVRRCARRFFGHFSSLWGQCSCRCRAHNSGSGCSGRIYLLVGAPGWLLQGCKPGGAGCPQG